MKITKVNYMPGEARILVDEFPKITFCIKLKKNTTKQDVWDELYDEIDKIKIVDDSEQVFNDLDLKSMEGTEFAGN